MLQETSVVGQVTWLGVVSDSEKNLRASAVQELDLTFAGQKGECHSGLTRPSCSRVLNQHPRGTTIRNTRQLSIVSEEELAKIANIMGIDEIHPSSVGASMVVKGIPDFSCVPPSSRLQQVGVGTTLCVDMQNSPCIFSGRVVAEDNPGGDNRAKSFKSAADGLRGITAWVEREGKIVVGDRIKLHIPTQRPWNADTSGKISGNSSKKGSTSLSFDMFLLISFAIAFVASVFPIQFR